MEGYWFRYALVMVILRGVLVLFTYIVRLIPNEEFENYNLLLIFLVIFIVLGVGKFFYFEEIYYLCIVLWESYVRLYNLFIIRFLFRIILLVVWFRCIVEGAIRVFYLCAWLKD